MPRYGDRLYYIDEYGNIQIYHMINNCEKGAYLEVYGNCFPYTPEGLELAQATAIKIGELLSEVEQGTEDRT